MNFDETHELLEDATEDIQMLQQMDREIIKTTIIAVAIFATIAVLSYLLHK